MGSAYKRLFGYTSILVLLVYITILLVARDRLWTDSERSRNGSADDEEGVVDIAINRRLTDNSNTHKSLPKSKKKSDWPWIHHPRGPRPKLETKKLQHGTEHKTARDKWERISDSINLKERKGNRGSVLKGSYFLKENSKYYTPYTMNRYEEYMHDLQQKKKKGVGPEVYPVWIGRHKLVMCLIPKNSISMWKMVLLRMVNPENDQFWWKFDKKIHSNRELKVRRLSPPHFNPTDIDAIYEDDRYHFVVTLRDPLERALSGFLYFKWYFKVDEFKDFPSYLFRMRDSVKSINHHVREQHLFCDLDRAHSRYREYAFSNASDRRRLLESLGDGIWDDIGATGWHPAAHLNIPQTREMFPEIAAADNIGSEWQNEQSLMHFGAPSGHSVSANTKVLEYYNNVTTITQMIRFYRRDYQLFHVLTVPQWVCTVVANALAMQSDVAVQELRMLLTEIEMLQDEKYPSCYPALKRCGMNSADCEDLVQTVT